MTTTTTTELSPTRAIRYAWGATRQNLAVLVPLGVLQLLLSSIEGSFAGMPRGTGALPHLLAQAAQVALAIGWWRIALRIHDGHAVSLAALREVSFAQYLQYLVTVVVYAGVVVLGLLLLIVPGVIWAMRYGLAPLLVVDQDLDVVAALRRSAELTRGAIVDLLLLALLLAGLNLLGALALGVGLVITLPISAMAVAFTYRQLGARAGARSSAPTFEPAAFEVTS